MKNVFALIIVLIMTTMNSTQAQNSEQKAVATAVEQLRKAMVKPTKPILNNLAMESLSYGHSNGLIENKEVFIESLVSGKYDFKTIELSEQTITIEGNTAIVRHTLFANTHDAGKDPGTVRLKVLTVWQKQNGKWLLLARQAVRV